jgi:hypothetical protein
MTSSTTWADFYLICFAVGFCFSFFSFVLGGARGGKPQLLHFHGHAGGHLPQVGTHPPAGAGNPASAGGTHAAGAHSGSAHVQPANHVSPFNLVTIAAFLAWFGGAGYLLTRYSGLWVGFGLVASAASGLVGGGIVFLFLSKVLISGEENMDPADYQIVGVLGRVCSPIRAGGTGEVIYSQVGTRRVCGARGEDGRAIAKGTEVIVTRYEKGIAYVRLWSEMSGEESGHGAVPEVPGSGI